MDLLGLAGSLLIVLICSVVISYACEPFEQGSGHLGRNMPPGVRGATLNAVASSLPELLTTFFLLFAYHDVDGFSAGIATCAGSAVFNAIIIPALCILAVMFVGVRPRNAPKGTPRVRVPAIKISRGTILRDGFFFLVAELLLIMYLGESPLAWWMGGVLLVVYAIYFAYLMYEFRTNGTDDGEEEEEDEDEDEDPGSFMKQLLTFDFRNLFFQGQALTNGRAWVLLGASTLVIAIACRALAGAVMNSADQLGVPAYFTAVILGAAATSVPDTVISVRDAMAGDYDDAVANALGSNIFDITVALGLPLMAYGLIYGPVHISNAGGAAANVQELRIALVITTVLTMGLFLSGKRMGKNKAIALFTLYMGWLVYIVGRAMGWLWLDQVVDTIAHIL